MELLCNGDMINLGPSFLLVFPQKNIPSIPKEGHQSLCGDREEKIQKMHSSLSSLMILSTRVLMHCVSCLFCVSFVIFSLCKWRAFVGFSVHSVVFQIHLISINFFGGQKWQKLCQDFLAQLSPKNKVSHEHFWRRSRIANNSGR